MQITIRPGRIRCVASRADWPRALRLLADSYPAAEHPLRDLRWGCDGERLAATIRWRWWTADGTARHYVTQRRRRGDHLHLSTNYPVGLPAILSDAAWIITQAPPVGIRLAQHPDTAWWVLTLDYEGGTMPAVELIER